MDDIVKRLDDAHEVSNQKILEEAADEIVLRRLMSEKLFNILTELYNDCSCMTHKQDLLTKEAIDFFVAFN